MRIRKHDVGERRWHLSVYFNGGREMEEFKNWVKENIPGCFCVHRDDQTSRYFEVRGNDVRDMMMLVMRWAS